MNNYLNYIIFKKSIQDQYLSFDGLLNGGKKELCGDIMNKKKCETKKKCYWNNRFEYCANDSVSIKKLKKYTHSLIFLHGFTMRGNEMKTFTKLIRKLLPKHINLKVILPNAPLRKITIYDGDIERAWYDYYTDHVHVEEEINEKHLEESCQEIHKLILKEIEYHGNSQKVFIGGYSQGCCQALYSSLTFPYKLGGIICLKGHIPSYTKTKQNYLQDIWACHGTADESIGFTISESIYNDYIKLGYKINFLSLQNTNHDLEDGLSKDVLLNLKNWIISRL